MPGTINTKTTRSDHGRADAVRLRSRRDGADHNTGETVGEAAENDTADTEAICKEAFTERCFGAGKTERRHAQGRCAARGTFWYGTARRGSTRCGVLG